MAKNNSRISDDENGWIHRQLFERMPFNISIIDRNYNIIDANDKFKQHFGRWRGKKCYQVYKKLTEPCSACRSFMTFENGKTRVHDEVGVDLDGKQSHYVVHTAPLRKRKNGPVEYIIEMSTDVTETQNWQQEYQVLFDRVPCYITVIDDDYRIIRSNEAFRENFGDVSGEHCYEVYKKRKTKCPKCPARKTFKDGNIHRSEQVGIKKSGDPVFYSVTTSPLRRGGEKIAHVIEISNDITEVKKLEKDIIDAERLGAVGQTVAGLAHSIKNILMGLEGGKYIVSLGLQKDDKALIGQGWEMLERNFDKTTTLVKDFLSFSKGRLPKFEMVDPHDLVVEIVELYKDISEQNGIELRSKIEKKIKALPLDPQGIHTCLTNLVSNAIDACQMSEKENCYVEISAKMERGNLIFEVADDGEGIDSEIKRKIFTTFFTTKGGGGTGLGLLTTRKIVQEHGGRITVNAKPGQGARFRMIFPRKRLVALYEEQKENNKLNLIKEQ